MVYRIKILSNLDDSPASIQEALEGYRGQPCPCPPNGLSSFGGLKKQKEKAVKVAFATKDLENINDHFGWAKQFVIYDVNKDGYSVCEVVKTEEDHADEADKIMSKIEAIRGVSIMYCQAIGPTAAAKVINNKIHPIKVETEKRIEDAANELVNMLNGNPPPWIKRIMAAEGVM